MNDSDSKNTKIFSCKLCEYTTGFKNDYLRHLMSNKHKKRANKEEEILSENIQKCEICNYETDNKYLYNKHLNSIKHKNNMYASDNKIKKNQCEKCNRIYSSRKNLWRHKQCCNDGNEDDGNEDDGNFSENSETDNETDVLKNKKGNRKPIYPTITPELLVDIINQNKELQSLMLEQQKYVVNNIANTTINTMNSNNNKTFNIQFFLNEHCKNAIDINEFVRTLDYSTKNLESNMRLGYTGGISKMITDKIRSTPVEERPLHCCDEKREKLYIRNNGEWITGNDSRDKIQSVIADIANNNYRTFQQWVRENPSCLTLDTPAYEKYTAIYNGVFGSRTDDEEVKHVKKILSNIINDIVIEKDKYLV